MNRKTAVMCLLAVACLALPAAAQNGLNYYFAQIAAADVWQTTSTYVNASAQTVTCTTSFISDSGAVLFLSFNGSSVSSTVDTIPAGDTARRQTDSQPNFTARDGLGSGAPHSRCAHRGERPPKGWV